MWLGDEEDSHMIYYLENESTRLYPVDTYFMDQYEAVPEYEYVSMTEKTPEPLAA